jgi:transcriptional regulator with XRE-family HTH domain
MAEDYNYSYTPVNNCDCFTFNNLGCLIELMKYGERLKYIRELAGFSQTALGEASGTSQANISKLELGDATGSEFTAQFADACGVDPMWLAAEKGTKPTKHSVANQLTKMIRDMDSEEQSLLLKIGHTLKKQEKATGTDGPTTTKQ